MDSVAWIVKVPPFPWLRATVLICAPSLTTSLGVLRVKSPPFPVALIPCATLEDKALDALLLATVPVNLIDSEALTVKSPALPAPKVSVVICPPSFKVRVSVSMMIFPPSPEPFWPTWADIPTGCKIPNSLLIKAPSTIISEALILISLPWFWLLTPAFICAPLVKVNFGVFRVIWLPAPVASSEILLDKLVGSSPRFGFTSIPFPSKDIDSEAITVKFPACPSFRALTSIWLPWIKLIFLPCIFISPIFTGLLLIANTAEAENKLISWKFATSS